VRTLAIAIVLAFLAGCASPAPTQTTPTPAVDGPIDLAGKLGLIAIDLPKRAIEDLSGRSTVAWVSPNGSRVFWNEDNFAIILDAEEGARDVVAIGRWARLYDNGSALELLDGEAAWRDVRSPVANATAPIASAPVQGSRWTQASDDLLVLGAEYIGPASLACANDIFVRANESARSRGCHLRIASDGRAGWTEAGGVRIREPTGEVRTLAPANGTREENPVFTDQGYLFLRLHGGASRTLTEVVDQDGNVLAKLTGSQRIALHDVTRSGDVLLASVFRGP